MKKMKGMNTDEEGAIAQYSLSSFILFISFILAVPAHASPQSDLAQTQQAMQQARTQQAKLAASRQQLQSELRALQGQLVSLSAQVRKSEADMADAEAKLRILDGQLQMKTAALDARKKEMAAAVEAALHLSGIPPEAAVMMPGDVTRTMTAASALKMISAGIRHDMRSIGEQMEEIAHLKEKVEQNREALRQQQAALVAQRQALQARLLERNRMRAALDQQQQQEARDLAKLAQKAQGLQELIRSLDEEAQENRMKQAASGQSPGERGRLRSFAAARGHVMMPAAGRVIQAFGVRLSENDTTRGIAIAAPAGAQVVAPYDGEVLFAGPFLHYGRMVILRHGDGFHSLLAGLAKIDVSAGQFLLEGEPIGAMGESGSEKLYLELRKNNQPVDPAPWMKVR